MQARREEVCRGRGEVRSLVEEQERWREVGEGEGRGSTLTTIIPSRFISASMSICGL